MKKLYLVGILGILILMILAASTFHSSDPLKDFNGPSYIPLNYHLTGNNTTENSTFLFYQGPAQMNFFIVGASKDPDKKIIKNIKSSFNNTTSQTANLLILQDNINVNGHTVTIKREEINFYGTLISFFETSWYCDDSKMTFVVNGVVPSSDMDGVKKMIESIKCHKNSLFGL